MTMNFFDEILQESDAEINDGFIGLQDKYLSTYRCRQALTESIKPLGCGFQEACDSIDAYSRILSARQSGTPFSYVFFDQDLPGIPSTDLVKAAAETCNISDTTFVRLALLGRQNPKPSKSAHPPES